MKRKHIAFGIVSLLLIVFAALGIWTTLRSGENYEPENTVSAMENKRSRVFVSGKSYALDRKTKKQHEQQEKKREDLLDAEDMGNNRNRSKDSVNAKTKDGDGTEGGQSKDRPKNVQEASETAPPGDDDDDDDDDGKDKYKDEEKKIKKDEEEDPDEEEEDYYKLTDKERKQMPSIKISLRDGEEVSGKKVDFWVHAKDCHGVTIPAFSNGDGKIEVWLNGARLLSSGSSGDRVPYRAVMKNGWNKIKVKAYDGYRKHKKWTPRTRVITRRVKCNAGQEAKVIGSVTVSISAPSIGVGTIAGGIKVDLRRSEPLSDILRKAFKKVGITPKMTDSYLYGLSRKNIAAGTVISEELEKKARGKNLQIDPKEKWPKNWRDHLNEKDFCTASGWTYSVNGYQPKVGIGAFKPEDGDEIALVFSLFEGDME